MIRLYFHYTPNPMKVALFLEEAGLDYEVVPVDTFKGEQHSPDFLKVNPNGKLPAIEDDGVPVFDSNAILLYLSEKTGKLGGKPEDRGSLLSWLMFVATGLGPYSGQAVHFQRTHTESAYATNRYRREAERHYRVLDDRLADRDYLVGGEFTIVDMAAWGWIERAPFVMNSSDTPLDATPNLKRWFQAIDSRPAVARVRRFVQDIPFKRDFDEVTLRSLFPQNYVNPA
ncbi:glutathione S-transferase family protein [Skermanella mucosa]|uniref:glutathione S-transferase family protein n=1 Tax=Skermanella mucosa TaxID=1789672 RepID=UPI00192B15FB|nr:glutathione S-transferase family protein [Skermanella mucosa]UEM23029.1 glutathione S-transferase family protein [Skermanella mucosa]